MFHVHNQQLMTCREAKLTAQRQFIEITEDEEWSSKYYFHDQINMKIFEHSTGTTD